MNAQVLCLIVFWALFTGWWALPTQARGPTLDPERAVMTMAPLLRVVTATAVSISVPEHAPRQEHLLLYDPVFRRFFGSQQRRLRRDAISAGSGVIVNARQGHVITNYHVVSGAEDIVVILKDRRRFEATMVGSDPDTDIALLKIDVTDLSDIPTGNSSTLEVGDPVFAIGNAFVLGPTVTTGIVSALGHGIGMHGYEDFIQTDASINPGNSGRALVNSKGELVGIHTAIIGPCGGNAHIRFAVPTNMASAIVDQLLTYGAARRGRLGVVVQGLNPDLAEALGVDGHRGAVVSQIKLESPAARAGLQPGDVITLLYGEPVEDSGVRIKVGLFERGTRVELTSAQDGEQTAVMIELGRPQATSISGEQTEPQLASAELVEIPTEHSIHGDVGSVPVEQIVPGSPSWVLGLRAGDIIVAVNQKPVASLSTFQEVVKSVHLAFALNVLRGDTQLFRVLR